MSGAGQAQAMRRELGQRLQELRLAAGLSQQQVARRAGYTRSAVSNAEAGGYARRRFWELCDELFGTGDMLARGYDEIGHRSAATSRSRAAESERDAGVPGLELLRVAGDAGSAAAALAVYQRLGWSAKQHEDGLTLVTGTVIDALEVPRAAGLLAARWWVFTRGAADEVRGLPALPRPEQAMAVVDAGDSLFFLARAAGPWDGGGVPAGARVPGSGLVAVRWHGLGSQIPAPPSPAGAGQPTAWAHLPRGRLRLAPAIGLLDLLAKAAAVAGPGGGRLAFPGGLLVVPVPGLRHPPLA
jgi:transcriptional regulator with XRE-family HTH domain